VTRIGCVDSLGLDEIDLVAKSIPGKSKNERTRSVLLLQGVASYLSTGVARVTHDKVKEACLHYDAWDSDNFARYLRNLSREVGGNRESGYMLTAAGLTAAGLTAAGLTAAGLTAATEMIKELFNRGDEESVRPKKREKRKAKA
jgi:hypothetical protein